MSQRSGLTRVEVFAVVAVVLVGAFVAWQTVRERPVDVLAKRVSCRANLRDLGVALLQYAESNDAAWPVLRDEPGMDYAHPMTRPAGTPWELGGGPTELHTAENLNLLAYEEFVGFRMFRCPGAGRVVMDRRSGPRRSYGFGDGDEVFLDYAYHNRYTQTKDGPNGAPFAEVWGAEEDADGRPGRGHGSGPRRPDAPSPALVITADRPGDTDYPARLAGPRLNHGRDGINYLRAGGDAGWHEGIETKIGPDTDFIFQSHAGGDGTPDAPDDSCLISPDTR